MMSFDIKGTIAGIKASIDALKNALELKQSIATNKEVGEVYAQLNLLQDQLITQSVRYDALAREKEAIEEELIQLKRHFDDAERYELFKLPAGSIVFRTKPDENAIDPTHYWCADCYHKQIKSILQPWTPQNSHTTLHCNTCGATLLNERIPMTMAVAYNPNKRGAF